MASLQLLKQAAQRRVMGQKDPRGNIGIFGRGKNIYKGGSNAAHRGGGAQYGRPRERFKTPVNRNRLMDRTRLVESQQRFSPEIIRKRLRSTR